MRIVILEAVFVDVDYRRGIDVIFSDRNISLLMNIVSASGVRATALAASKSASSVVFVLGIGA